MVLTFFSPPEKPAIELRRPDLPPSDGGDEIGAGGGGGGGAKDVDVAGGGGARAVVEVGVLGCDEVGVTAVACEDIVATLSPRLRRFEVFFGAFFLLLTVSEEVSFFLFLMLARSSSMSSSKGSLKKKNKH